MMRSSGCTPAVSMAWTPFSASWMWRNPISSSAMRVICRTLFWSSTMRTLIAPATGIFSYSLCDQRVVGRAGSILVQGGLGRFHGCVIGDWCMNRQFREFLHVENEGDAPVTEKKNNRKTQHGAV